MDCELPTYEYVCTDCGTDLEVVQSIKDDALTVCPSCGGKLRKVFGNVGVVFKGSGFYKTDSRAEAKRRAGSGRSGSDAKPDAGTGAKSGAGSDSAGSGSGSGAGDKAPASTGSGSGASDGKAGGSAAGKGDKSGSGKPAV